MEETAEETIDLGGSISLSGFKELDGGHMIILKKIIGNYGKIYSEKLSSFQRLSLRLKPIHETEASKKFQINSKVEADRIYTSEVVDRSIFTAVDQSLKKIKNEIGD